MSLLSSLAGLKSFANPWLLLAVLLMVLGAAGTGARYGYNYAQRGHAAQELLIAEATQAAQKAAANEIAKIKIVHQTNQTRLEREIVKVPDFSQCHTGTDALRVLNDALAGQAGAEPAGDSGVPKTDGPGR